jgi:hypothetical protein
MERNDFTRENTDYFESRFDIEEDGLILKVGEIFKAYKSNNNSNKEFDCEIVETTRNFEVGATKYLFSNKN